MFDRLCTSSLRGRIGLTLVMAGLAAFALAAASAQVQFAKIGDTVVDPAALTFPAGSAFGSAINGLAFQQDAIHTTAGWQYLAYYDGQRHVALARRHLPKGEWQSIHFLDYDFKSVDAHNTISMGICEKDGTIHLAFDHHVHPLHYRSSKPGVATHPDAFKWDASLFGPIHQDLEAGKPIVVTYPRFWNTPGGGLQFHYRRGSSGSGDNMLVDYHPETGAWSNTRQIDSGSGDFQDELGPNNHRNAYPNGYDYDSTGRLHATWVWRENSQGSNHDLNYDYSDDGGNTWFNDLGEPIQGFANVNTPHLVVRRLSRRDGLMNNHAQAIDSQNRAHVVMWSSSSTTTPTAKGAELWGPPQDRRYHHYWREAPGKWHDDVLPFVAGSRPRLFVDGHDNLILIYGRLAIDGPMQGFIYAPGDLVVLAATAKTRWQDWKIVVDEKGPFVNEMLGDPQRWKTERILSVMVQQTPDTLGTPSPLRVVDYKLEESE